MIRRIHKHHYICISVLLLALFIFENTQLLGINDYFDFYPLFFIKLALWCMLGFIIKTFPAPRVSGLVRLKGTVCSLALIFAVFYLLCQVFIGLFSAFGKNTYSLSLIGILSNVVTMAATLVSGELCRSFLINSVSRRRPYVMILLCSLLFALFNIQLGNIRGFETNMDMLVYFINVVFPQLTLSFAASYFVYLAGPVPAILYLGLIRLFNYTSPYIPNPPEIVKLLFNTLFPLLSIAVVLKLYTAEASEADRSHTRKTGTLSWGVVSVLSVAIVWFSVGVFPIYPSVILTGSMEPGIMPGDIVIVEKTGSKGVEIGDIVMYYSPEGIYITHRVIEITSEAGVPQFVTKGDNNAHSDVPNVAAEQIKGRVIGVIPAIGKLSLYVRSAGNAA